MGQLVNYFLDLQRNPNKDKTIPSEIVEVLHFGNTKRQQHQYQIIKTNYYDLSNEQVEFNWIYCWDYRFSYVPWVKGKISRLKSVWPKDDFLSTGFLGCYMAHFMYGNNYYGAHIHTGGPTDKKKMWGDFIRNNKLSYYTVFEPDSSFAFNKTKQALRTGVPQLYETWGIISGSNYKCYTVIVERTNAQNHNGTKFHSITEMKEYKIIRKIS